MNWKQFYNLVLIPTLHKLEPDIPYSKQAELLVSETIFHESGGLNYIAQIPNDGPGLGICMMEKPTWDWLTTGKYSWVPEIWGHASFSDLTSNLALCVAMCRLRYWVVKDSLPPLSYGINGRADYWGKFYQTENDPVKKAKYIYDARDLANIR